MSDLIGQTLGHYRIVEKIGEGGMGEVYRAHDERLDRDVAVKVLHEAVVRDADRMARFEREAKAVAKLDHPNILAIHDFASEDGVTYAVTELLDGQDLRHAVPPSGMSWQKVVEIGAAIADGLAAAHGKGVIHRDLKPENVFITADGRVKVLDFGLARVKEPVKEEAETATLTPAGTVAGTIMGTLGYMSPEQLRGESTDARSDIFVLGCVLYEMLSGRTAFLRNSTAETTAAILKEEPERLSSTGSVLPAELERTIHRCLEKSPDARFQSAADLAFNLRSIGSGSGVPVVRVSTGSAKVAGGTTKSRFLWVGLITAGLAIAAVASWWALTQRASDEAVRAKAFQSMTITPVTSLGNVWSAAISPDGRQLAYVRDEAGGRSIWVRQVATGSEVEVIAAQKNLGIKQVDFTPDGEHLVFCGLDSPGQTALNAIFRVPTLGGEVRRVVSDADGLPSFSPDGRRFAFRRGIPGRGAALMVANADGSGVRELAVGETMWPVVWSPGGRTITAALSSAEGWQPFAFDVDTGARHAIANDLLIPDLGGLAWLPDGGDLLVAGKIPDDKAARQIWRFSTDEGTLSRVTNDLNDYHWMSLSADGAVLATLVWQYVGHLFVAPADDPDRVRQLTRGSRERVLAVAADDHSVVFQRSTNGQEWELWACDEDGNDLRRLNTVSSTVVPEGVSAGGGEFLFTARGPDGSVQIWRIDDHENMPVPVTATEKEVYGPSLAPDGTWFTYILVVNAGIGNMSMEAWKQPLDSGEPVLLEANTFSAAVSPDGKQIALAGYREGHGSSPRLEVVPAEGGSPLVSVEFKGTGGLRWLPDGQGVSFIRYPDGQVWLQPLDGKPAKQLTHVEQRRIRSHTWSPDGKWLYLVLEDTTSDAVLIRNF